MNYFKGIEKYGRMNATSHSHVTVQCPLLLLLILRTRLQGDIATLKDRIYV